MYPTWSNVQQPMDEARSDFYGQAPLQPLFHIPHVRPPSGRCSQALRPTVSLRKLDPRSIRS